MSAFEETYEGNILNGSGAMTKSTREAPSRCRRCTRSLPWDYIWNRCEDDPDDDSQPTSLGEYAKWAYTRHIRRDHRAKKLMIEVRTASGVAKEACAPHVCGNWRIRIPTSFDTTVVPEAEGFRRGYQLSAITCTATT